MTERSNAAGHQIHYWLALCLLVIGVSSTPSQAEESIRQITVSRLGREEGLPSTQVHALVESPTGALWVAGPSGLALYDGTRTRVFGTKQGLSTHGLRSLALSADGSIWIGHDQGVDRRLPDGRFEPLTRSPWSFGFVEEVLTDSEGAWIGTSSGLVRWTPDLGVIAETTVAKGLVSELTQVNGQIWAAGPTLGLWRFHNDQWSPAPEATWQNIATVSTITSGPDSTIWIGGSRGFAWLDAQGKLLEQHTGKTGEYSVTAMMMADDQLWVARGGKLEAFSFIDHRWQSIGILVDPIKVNEMHLDAQGNIWIASESSGVAKVSVLRRSIARLRQPCVTQVYSIRPTADGGFLVGGEHCSWRVEALSRPGHRLESLDEIKVWDMIEDPSGSLWAATQHGLYHSPAGSGFIEYPSNSRLDSQPGRALLLRDSGLWVATVDGLFVVNGQSTREILDPEGHSMGYVYSLIEDATGRLWMGTIGRGAWHEDESGAPQRPAISGLSPRGNVYAFSFDNSGKGVMVQDDNLLLIENGVVRALEKASDDAVAGWSLLMTDPDHLWVGSSRGLLLYELNSGKLQRHLTRDMGLSGDEFTSSRSLASTTNGELLLGMDSGLSVVSPRRLDEITLRPKPLLSEVRWRQAELGSNTAIPQVSSGPWTLQLFLSSSWFIDERGLQFRYRLDGFNQNWVALTSRGESPINYTGLPAGDYQFRAQVFSPLLGWGPEAELYRFRVEPIWWQRPVALILWALLGSLAVSLLVVWRTASIRQRAIELQSVVKERTSELRQANRELKELAARDSLTGLLNRRALWEEAENYAAIARRQDLVFGLMVFDLDRFKQINDTLGHPVGDQVLCHVAKVVGNAMRKGEVLARWGGEEFIILLAPQSEPPDLLCAAERIRQCLAENPLLDVDDQPLSITCSVGASHWTADSDDLQLLLKQADSALYQAKVTRNCSVVWQDPDKQRIS